MAVFASRQIVMSVVPQLVAVTITGSGDSTYCYAMINGTKQYSSGTHEVNAGDTITFCVFGRRMAHGWVVIDGTQVLEISNASTQTYDWTVPSGISTIEIAMSYSPSTSMRNGRITVTTS